MWIESLETTDGLRFYSSFYGELNPKFFYMYLFDDGICRLEFWKLCGDAETRLFDYICYLRALKFINGLFTPLPILEEPLEYRG